jgi:hypothetical protein
VSTALSNEVKNVALHRKVIVPARDQKFGIFYAAVEDAIRDCVTV